MYFKLFKEFFSQEVRDFLPKITGVVCKLLAVQEVFLHDISAVSLRLSDRERSTTQFLEIATNQMLLDRYIPSLFVFCVIAF